MKYLFVFLFVLMSTIHGNAGAWSITKADNSDPLPPNTIKGPVIFSGSTNTLSIAAGATWYLYGQPQTGVNIASNLVQLDSSARLPAVDGSLLTNVNSSLLGGQAGAYYLALANQTGYGSGAQTALANPVNGNYGVPQINGSGQLPAVSGALLTNLSVYSSNITTPPAVASSPSGANLIGQPLVVSSGSPIGGVLSSVVGGSVTNNGNGLIAPSSTGMAKGGDAIANGTGNAFAGTGEALGGNATATGPSASATGGKGLVQGGTATAVAGGTAIGGNGDVEGNLASGGTTNTNGMAQLGVGATTSKVQVGSGTIPVQMTGVGQGTALLGLMTLNTTTTITFNNNGQSETIYNTLASALSGAIFTLPATTNPGQLLRYVSAYGLTSSSMAGAPVDVGVGVSSLAANVSVCWQSDVAGHWVRLQ